jgi:hypothetical protein
MIHPFRLVPFTRRVDRTQRLLQLVLAGLALLLLSLWDPVGTPGPVICGARRAFGIPCPFCGVTRGVSMCLRGRPVEASALNPLTVPFFAIGLGLMALWTFEYLADVRVTLRFSKRVRAVVYTLAGLVLLTNWIFLLTYRREDDFWSSWLGRLLSIFGAGS